MIDPYGGWIIALSESTLAITSVLNVARGASGSGYASQGPSIWMSGGGPAADSAGNVYVLTANGRFETSLNAGGFPSGGDYGNSFVKISSSGGTLAVADYFTMSGEVAESTNDNDLGSGGVMLLPDLTDANGTVRHLAVGAGKDGNLYVVNRDGMGKFSSVGNNIWQELDGVLGAGVWATPAYFNSSIYYGPQGGSLKAFSVTDARLSSSPTSQTSTQLRLPRNLPGRLGEWHGECDRLGVREYFARGAARLRSCQSRHRAVQQQPGVQRARPLRRRQQIYRPGGRRRQGLRRDHEQCRRLWSVAVTPHAHRTRAMLVI